MSKRIIILVVCIISIFALLLAASPTPVDAAKPTPAATPTPTPTPTVTPGGPTATPTPTPIPGVFYVGPGRAYTHPSQIVNLVGPGDLVLVDGDATYSGDTIFTISGTAAQPITIRGVRVNGKRPLLTNGVNTIEFRLANHYVLEGFEMTNGSARLIYHHNNDLTVRDCVAHDSLGQGIISADEDSGSLLVEYTEAYNVGNATGEHCMYITNNEIDFPGSVNTIRYNYIHDAGGGNNIKSRSERCELLYNWIEDAYYHNLEFIGLDTKVTKIPENQAREDSEAVGNVFMFSADRQGFYQARCGGDGTGQTWGRVRFLNNTFIQKPGDAHEVFRLFDGLESFEANNNVFYQPGTGAPSIELLGSVDWLNGIRSVAGSNNWVETGTTNIPAEWTGTITGANPGFVNEAAGDFRPAAGSALINAGTLPGAVCTGHEFPNPLYAPQYQPGQRSTAATPRSINGGTIDIGAYEY